MDYSPLSRHNIVVSGLATSMVKKEGHGEVVTRLMNKVAQRRGRHAHLIYARKHHSMAHVMQWTIQIIK